MENPLSEESRLEGCSNLINISENVEIKIFVPEQSWMEFETLYPPRI